MIATWTSSGSALLSRQIGYAAGNFGKNIVWTTFDTFALYYFVAVLGLPVVHAGAIVAVAMVGDALLDIAIGAYADRRGGTKRLRHYLLIAASLCGLPFAVMFAIPALSGSVQPAPVLVFYLLARLGYAVGDVAHNTLLVGIAPTPGEATRVSGYRLLFSAAGAAAVGYAVSMIYDAPLGDRGAAMAMAGIGGGVLYAMMMGVVFAATRNWPYGVVSQSRGPQSRMPLRRSLRSLYPLLVLAAMQSAFVPLFTRALPFYAAEVYGDPAWAGHALRMLALSQALSLVAWITVAGRISHRTMFVASHGLNILGVTLMLAVPGALIDLPLVLLGLGYAGMNMAIWAMIPDIVRRDHDQSLSVALFVSTLKGGALLGITMLTGILWLPTGVFAASKPLVVVMTICGSGFGSLLCIATVVILLRSGLGRHDATRR